MEVNDMLREYQLEHSSEGLLAEQFNFQPVPENDTVINTYNVQNWQVHIMSWATPTQIYWAAPSRREVRVDRYEPRMEYLSGEEYEEKKRNWELRSWCVYCVLN